MNRATLKTLLVGAFLFVSKSFALPHQGLEITLTPALKSLAVTDTMSLEPSHTYHFTLNKSLQVAVTSSGNQQLRLVQAASGSAAANEYELVTGADETSVTLQYSGVVYDPVVDNDSTGLISAEGVALFGNSYWVPGFTEKTTYEIHRLDLPADWKLASPMKQRTVPQQDIYLIAANFQEYDLPQNETGVGLKIYLRSADAQLAQTFLSLLPGYLDHYNTTFGAYPYDTFAMIENFWETGFGMPAFTLLGPGTIRLPYILNSSVPHELLHNWWGNSVYVDYDRGNWCEGLTTYLADHWQQELLKADRDYRLQALINFQDYTKSAGDFPLRDFKQRFSFSSQAVGYGKGMMLFHMLKVRLGEDVFNQALRDLYKNFRGQSISYQEIEQTFENASHVDLKAFFKQWLDRTGAPTLTLEKPQRSSMAGAKYQVDFQLRQTSAQNYELTVPARFTFADGSSELKTLNLSSDLESFQFTFAKSPTGLEIDPNADVFRNLDIHERPVSFSNIFGASKIYVTGTDATVNQAYQQTWQAAVESTITLSDDKILLDLPAEGAVVMLGDSPQYEQLMAQELAGQDLKIAADAISIFGTSYPRGENKTALVARSLKHPGVILAWIRGAQSETLAPRLLHYGKFGVLVFSDTSVPLKATWPVLNSPLKIQWP